MVRLILVFTVVLVWTTAEPLPPMNGNVVTCVVCKEAVKIMLPLLEETTARIVEEFVVKCKEYIHYLPFAESICRTFANREIAKIKAAIEAGANPDAVCQKVYAC